MNDIAIADVKGKSKTDIAKEVMDDFAIYQTYRQRTWEKIARKCEKFYYGDQWSAGDKQVMYDQKRAPAVFNNVLPVIDLIVGYQVSTRVDLAAKPVDKHGDVILADIITSVIKNIEWINNSGFECRFQFLDGLVAGFGIKENWIEPDADLQPVIRTEQKSPWHFYLDPGFEKYDYRDAKKLFKETWMSKEDIELTFGKKVAKQVQFPESRLGQIAIMDTPSRWDRNSDDYGNRSSPGGDFDSEATRTGYDMKRNLVRVIEQYEKKYDRVEMYFDPETHTAKMVDELTEMEQDLVQDSIIPMVVGYIRMTTVIGNSIVAQDKEIKSKKSGNVEFYHLFNMYFPYWLNGKYWGVIENLIYPQQDVNKHYQQIIHILNSYANSGLYYEEGAMAPEDEAGLEDRLARTGAAIKLAEGGLAKIKEIDRHEAPQTLFSLVGLKAEMMKYISAAQDAIQGQSRRAQSGKAKESEVTQSAMKLQGIVDNFRETQKLEGKADIWWIQNFYTGERMVRVLGDEYGQDMQSIELNKSMFGELFNDVTIGRYDITLEFEGKTQSERDRIKYLLVELSNTVPQYADIIAKYVLQYSDMPQKEKILQEFEQRQQLMQQQAQQALATGQPPVQFGGKARGGIQGAPRPGRGVTRQAMSA